MNRRPTTPRIAQPSFVKVDAQPSLDVRPSTSRGDYEGGWQRILVPPTSNTRVFSTTRRWAGVDVYLARPAFEADVANPILRFKIFAVIEGMDRTLVATGCYRHNAPGGPPIYPSTWVCGARCVADRFDVEMSCTGTPVLATDAVNVGVVASDELVAMPEHLGAIPLNELGSMFAIGPAKAPTLVAGDPGYEVVGVHASRAAGAATRWLHLLNADSTNPIVLAGAAPMFAFGFPAVGDSVIEGPLAAFGTAYARFEAGLSVGISSTGVSYANVNAQDVAFQVWFR